MNGLYRPNHTILSGYRPFECIKFFELIIDESTLKRIKPLISRIDFIEVKPPEISEIRVIRGF
jgi:hypothetical protein